MEFQKFQKFRKFLHPFRNGAFAKNAVIFLPGFVEFLEFLKFLEIPQKSLRILKIMFVLQKPAGFREETTVKGTFQAPPILLGAGQKSLTAF